MDVATSVVATFGSPIGFVLAAVTLVLGAGFACPGRRRWWSRSIADSHRRLLFAGPSGTDRGRPQPSLTVGGRVAGSGMIDSAWATRTRSSKSANLIIPLGISVRPDATAGPASPVTPMTRSIERASYQGHLRRAAARRLAYALLQSLVTPVLSTIQHDLHTSQSTVTWVLTVYLLSASIFTPILGRVGDMVGKERMLVVTLLALAVGSVLAGLAQSIGVLIVARAIQGIGGAVLPLAFGIIRDEFPQDQGGHRGGRRGRHDRRRRRGRDRPGRTHRQAPRLPLAVLDPTRSSP